MDNKHVWLCFLLISFLAFAGCGGGKGGSPGSSGSEDTGILIQAVSVVGNATDGDDPPDIDVAIHLCPPDFIDAEPGLFRVGGTMSITATALNPDTAFDPFPATVEVCTITYLKANQDPAAPIVEKWEIFPNCPIVDAEAQECQVQIIDIDRKTDFWSDILQGINQPDEIPTHYVAAFNCNYVNVFGERGKFQTEYDIFLWDFDNCS